MSVARRVRVRARWTTSRSTKVSLSTHTTLRSAPPPLIPARALRLVLQNRAAAGEAGGSRESGGAGEPVSLTRTSARTCQNLPALRRRSRPNAAPQQRRRFDALYWPSSRARVARERERELSIFGVCVSLPKKMKWCELCGATVYVGEQVGCVTRKRLRLNWASAEGVWRSGKRNDVQSMRHIGSGRARGARTRRTARSEGEPHAATRVVFCSLSFASSSLPSYHQTATITTTITTTHTSPYIINHGCEKGLLPVLGGFVDLGSHDGTPRVQRGGQRRSDQADDRHIRRRGELLVEGRGGWRVG